MKRLLEYSNRFRILKGGKISLVVSALLAGTALTHAAPVGGSVTSGAASIGHSGSVTTISQSTDKASINWQSFSIAPQETVNFVQPSRSSITLNRVTGATQSLIEGAMNANGQVFLINPNGILFAEGSRVNVGGLVASTRDISDEDFLSGNYRFEGNSAGGILNRGSITAAEGGYVAMIGKSVVNQGSIVATLGNVQMAGGDRVSLDLNGNSLLKLTIDRGTLDALVENGGLIQADGGTVYLTTQALDSVLDGMVNNSGIIEAASIGDLTGDVVLYAHGGTMNLGGSVDAAGSFVETSGKAFAIAEGSSVNAAQWLIDPVNIAIDATLAGTIATALGSGDVTISTDGGNTPDTSSGESGTAGNIDVDSAIAWSADNTLTLSAYNNINVNADITHSGTSAGGLIFLYGQGSADGGSSAYSVNGGATVSSPSMQWRKGSDLASTRYAIVDNNVFLGGTYIELGINMASGGKFGTTTKPSLFFGRQGGNAGVGMTGDADGFGTGADLRIDYFLPGSPYEAFLAQYDISSVATTSSNFATGITLHPLASGNVMSATVTGTLGGNLQTEQVITLSLNDKYFNNEVTLTNAGASLLENVTFVRSFDPDNTVDIGGSYSTIQSLDQTMASGDAATVVSATSQAGDAYATASGGNQAKILYYTTDSRADGGYGSAFFGGTVDQMVAAAAPLSKGDTTTGDIGMGIIFNAGTLAASESTTFSYFTSLDNRDLSTILTELGNASAPAPAADPTPAPAPVTEPDPVVVDDTAVQNVVTAIVNNTVVAPVVPQPIPTEPTAEGTPLPESLAPEGEGSGFTLVGTTDGAEATETTDMETLLEAAAGQGVTEIRVPLGNGSIVELVNGGVRLPAGVSQEFYIVANGDNEDDNR